MATVWLVGFDDRALHEALTRAGHAVERWALDPLLSNEPPPPPDVGLVKTPAQATIATLRRLALHAPTAAWVGLLDAEAEALAAPALDAGAADVCLGTLDARAAPVLVSRVLRDHRAKSRLTLLDQRESKNAQLDEVIAESSQMRELLEQILRISRRSALGPPLSILLTGETGTGKGLLAKVIHYANRRREGPYVEVNCAAIPSTLLEAELFGYERGAFTDAKSSRVGLLEAAHGGTLFLDEVSYLPPEGQAKLLTALETRRVRRLGGTAERQVDVQVLAASSHDLNQQVAEGAFRPELLHRLAALWFKLPPLRERGGDAIVLAERFLQRLTRSYGLSPKTLSEDARAAIRAYHWPGNVRELYHAIERAVLSEDHNLVQAADLALMSAEAHPPRPASPPAGARPEGAAVTVNGKIEIHLPPEGVALHDVERALIERALEMEGGNVSRAAALLRITRDTLRSRMEKFGLSARATRP